ncbi:response regulator transcription factor [Streptosporangium lutulentum]
MDLRMPSMDGVQATRHIVRDHPATAVLVLTMFHEDALVAEALHAGARGYLLKTAEQDEIERAIRAVAAGDAIFSSAVAGRVLGRITPARDTPYCHRCRRASGRCSISSPRAPRTPPSPTG